jgi:hypothetical protein
MKAFNYRWHYVWEECGFNQIGFGEEDEWNILVRNLDLIGFGEEEEWNILVGRFISIGFAGESEWYIWRGRLHLI